VSANRGIDHLVIAVNDLPAARDRYSRLGFCTTPLGKHPWGTGNHLVQFPRNFIELLGVISPDALVPMSDAHFSFGDHNAAFLRRREGMSMLVLSTEDARADAHEWRAHGLHVYEPFHWSRKATLPDGSETTVAFTLTFVTNPLMPAIAFFSCQQHNPEAFWKPEFQVHANGASGVSGVTLVDPSPARHAAFLSSLVGDADIDEAPEALAVHCAGGVIRVLSPGRFAARFPSAQSAKAAASTPFRAASIDAADLEQVARCLTDNGIGYTRSDSAVQVSDDQCCGIALEFVQGRGAIRAA
jgi:catechol 2,3-dioxygenase-like lactoylglutathione lyase family enzyme